MAAEPDAEHGRQQPMIFFPRYSSILVLQPPSSWIQSPIDPSAFGALTGGQMEPGDHAPGSVQWPTKEPPGDENDGGSEGDAEGEEA